MFAEVSRSVKSQKALSMEISISPEKELSVLLIQCLLLNVIILRGKMIGPITLCWFSQGMND